MSTCLHPRHFGFQVCSGGERWGILLMMVPVQTNFWLLVQVEFLLTTSSICVQSDWLRSTVLPEGAVWCTRIDWAFAIMVVTSCWGLRFVQKAGVCGVCVAARGWCHTSTGLLWTCRMLWDFSLVWWGWFITRPRQRISKHTLISTVTTLWYAWMLLLKCLISHGLNKYTSHPYLWY